MNETKSFHYRLAHIPNKKKEQTDWFYERFDRCDTLAFSQVITTLEECTIQDLSTLNYLIQSL